MKLFLLLALLTGSAWAGPVMLKVEVLGNKDTKMQGKQSKGKSAGIPERVTTDTRDLEITLNNTGAAELNLTVVTYLFAKDAKEKDIVLSKKMEKTLALPAHAIQKFTTDKAVITFHSLSSKTKGGKNEVKPATGAKFAGFGVQVMAGNELMVELFEPKELKASTGLTETSTLYDEDKWKKKKKAN